MSYSECLYQGPASVHEEEEDKRVGGGEDSARDGKVCESIPLSTTEIAQVQQASHDRLGSPAIDLSTAVEDDPTLELERSRG